MRALLLTLLAAVALTLPASAPATAALPSVTCPGCWHPSTQARWQYQPGPPGSTRPTASTSASSAPKHGGAVVHPTVTSTSRRPEARGNPITPNTEAVDAIHARGGHAICYVSAGSWENWRGDATLPGIGQRQDQRLAGRALAGHPPDRHPGADHGAAGGGLRRNHSTRRRVDNVDGYTNDTGFPLTARDQLAYNVRLANLAHAHGLSVALKNDLEQLAALGRTSTSRSTSSVSSTTVRVCAAGRIGKAVFGWYRKTTFAAASPAGLACALSQSLNLYARP